LPADRLSGFARAFCQPFWTRLCVGSFAHLIPFSFHILCTSGIADFWLMTNFGQNLDSGGYIKLRWYVSIPTNVTGWVWEKIAQNVAQNIFIKN
jgi:hypothetical protein